MAEIRFEAAQEAGDLEAEAWEWRNRMIAAEAAVERITAIVSEPATPTNESEVRLRVAAAIARWHVLRRS